MEQGTTYSPPMILSDVDDDIIHARMLGALPNDIDKTEGGFAHDFTRPAALEKAEMMMAINDAVQVFFPAWSYAGYLDQLANGVGLTRRPAQPAETTLEVKGTPDTIIPEGFVFATHSSSSNASVEFAAVNTVTIGPEGTANVLVRCTETGSSGNVPENSITLMSTPIMGITAIKNPEAATGGVEEEEDDVLRARIEEREKSNEFSFVGNDNDYRRWAQEVVGVGSVTVIPEWKGAGTGTVRLVVMDISGSPASHETLQAVYNHIISPDDRSKRLAPMDAILTVDTARTVTLNVSAELYLDEGKDIRGVSERFKAALTAYFEEAKAEGYIRFTRIGSVLSETNGILDYKNLMINGGTDNIQVSVDEYPTAGEIKLTEVN